MTLMDHTVYQFARRVGGVCLSARRSAIYLTFALTMGLQIVLAGQTPGQQASATYENRLTPCSHPTLLLGDHPEFMAPIHPDRCFEAPGVLNDPDADLTVKSWRYSVNVRAVIEMVNHLRANQTALIVVHPWGIDDGQGWRTPAPAGVADYGDPEKNTLVEGHSKRVLNPFLKSLRGKVALVMYSLPGNEDAIRKKMYRSIDGTPTEAERLEGAKELAAKLNSFSYRGRAVPSQLDLSQNQPVVDYFRLFPGADWSPKYDPPGYWDLPIPVSSAFDVAPEDVVIYDKQGYPALRQFLQSQGIRHVLLTGYSTDMCYKGTTAGYDNLSQDFNVFLVGDATVANFWANSNPKFATNFVIDSASVNHMITQISWVTYQAKSKSLARNSVKP